MDDVRKRSRWRTCRPRDGSVTAVSQVMGTAPQAIAGSAILRHMPRRMRRGHRRYSMRSGLIPPMRPRAPQPGRGFGAHRSRINLVEAHGVGIGRLQRGNPTFAARSQRSSPSSATTAAELPSLSGASNPCQLSDHHDSSLSPLSHHFRHAARMSTPAPISHKCSTVLLVVQRAQELHLHHVGTVMVFVIHAASRPPTGCVRARTCLCPRRRGPLGASGARPACSAIPAVRVGEHVDGFLHVGRHRNALRLRSSDQFLQFAFEHGDTSGGDLLAHDV